MASEAARIAANLESIKQARETALQIGADTSRMDAMIISLEASLKAAKDREQPPPDAPAAPFAVR